MAVARAAELLDPLETVDISFAAFRCLAPAPGLLATTLWEFDPEEPARQRVYFEGEPGIRRPRSAVTCRSISAATSAARPPAMFPTRRC